MKKKSKNKSMYLVLTFLLVLVAGITTYAIYKTSLSGTANVSAANWIVKVTANSTTTNVTGGASNINLGVCANKLAPGGSCTIPFTVDMTESEVDSILTVGIGNSIDASTLALMNEAGLSLKISDGTLEGYAYILNYGTTKVLNLVIDWEAGLEVDDNKASADVALSKNIGTLTIPVNMIVRQHNGQTRTVTFNKNTEDSNIETPASVQVIDGGSISTIPDLNSENVVFIGWYTSPTGGAKLTNSTPIIDNITYYAHYGVMKTVTFNTHGGSSVSPISVGEGRSISSLPESTKSGYKFIGWFTLEEGGTELTTSTVIDSDITYHAHWQSVPVYAIGQEVYFDPTSADTACSSQDHSASTCMKWKVISVNDTSNNSTIKLQLDHNITNKLAWNTNGNSSVGPTNILTSLANQTRNWLNVDPLTYTYNTSASTYNYGTLSCDKGDCSIKGSNLNLPYKLRARIITAEEMAQLTATLPNTSGTYAANWSLSNQNWFWFSRTDYQVGTQASGTGNVTLKWLVENTGTDSGSQSSANNYDSENFGYWTLSPSSQGSSQAYVVNRNGRMIYDSLTTSGSYGARPVITIPKSKIK